MEIERETNSAWVAYFRRRNETKRVKRSREQFSCGGGGDGGWGEGDHAQSLGM